jgi:hypothetical protein
MNDAGHRGSPRGRERDRRGDVARAIRTASTPVTIHVDDERRRIDVRVAGLVSYEEAMRLIAYRRAHGLTAYALLVDLSEAESDLSGAQVRQLAEARRHAYGGGGVGATVVVAPSDVLFGMARMYEILSENTAPIRVARTWAEAEATIAAAA